MSACVLYLKTCQFHLNNVIIDHVYKFYSIQYLIDYMCVCHDIFHFINDRNVIK